MRANPNPLSPCRLGAAIVTLMLAPAVLGAETHPTIDVSEVVAGQTGYGLSVFRGAEPERFEVEVLGVLRDVAPGTSYILARLSGQDLEETGVIAGMSGSPVYLDGRLAGAVAFSWPFSKGAIAGITPIGAMRGLLADAVGAGDPPRGASATAVTDLVTPLPESRLVAAIAALAPAPRPDARAGIQWTAAGFGAGARSLLEAGLGAVAPAGSASSTVEELVPGGAVAGVLIDGDLKLAATGTVTDRVGDDILAFGHPFLGLGPVEIPMATAEVLTILSSQLSSFKIAGQGKIVGAFRVDRQPGIKGTLGVTPRTIPMRVDVRGESASRVYDLRLADVPLIAPTLMAIGALGCLDSTTRAGGAQGLDVGMRFVLAGGEELALERSFDGPAASIQSATFLLALAGFLLQNPLEQVDLARVELVVEQVREPRTARLVAAHADRTVVGPGDTVGLNVDLVAYRGEPFRERLEVELPRGLPAGRYSLLVGDGPSVDVARLQVEAASPVTFAQALRLLRSFHSPRDLVVLGVFAEKGLAVAGEVLPQLPGSLRSIWGGAASGSATPLRLAVAQEVSRRLAVPISGGTRVDLTVERREPVVGERASPGPPEGEPGGGAQSGEGGPNAQGSGAEPALGRGTGATTGIDSEGKSER